MKRPMLLALAALVAGTGMALAAPPAKTVDGPSGPMLVDGKGMTLYTFDKDTPGVSTCYDKCAVAWPPFAAAANAVAEGDWTVVKRTDGTAVWAYDGMPLYTFVKDKKPGDVTGEGVGGVWHIAK